MHALAYRVSRMSRVTRIVAVASVLLFIGGAIVMLLTGRSAIESANDRVKAQWAPLATALQPRYSHLGTLAKAVRAAQDDRVLLRDIDASLARWQRIKSTDIDELVVAANRIEGLASRLLRTIETSPRLRSVEAITQAVQTYGQADPTASARPFNAAVEQYDETRGSLTRRLAAMAFGFEERRTFERPAT